MTENGSTMSTMPKIALIIKVFIIAKLLVPKKHHHWTSNLLKIKIRHVQQSPATTYISVCIYIRFICIYARILYIQCIYPFPSELLCGDLRLLRHRRGALAPTGPLEFHDLRPSLKTGEIRTWKWNLEWKCLLIIWGFPKMVVPSVGKPMLLRKPTILGNPHILEKVDPPKKRKKQEIGWLKLKECDFIVWKKKS